MNSQPSKLGPPKTKSTYVHLDRVAPNLYRHRVSGLYYGFRKIAGKRRCLSLKTADRRTADRKLAEWLRDVGEVDTSNADATLAMLIESFVQSRAGKARSTIVAEAGILKTFRESFPKPMSTLVSRVKPSDIAIWLARVKVNRRASTFNRWRLMARQLFDMAETDGLVSRSPFVDRVLPRAKKEQVIRLIPTEDQFRAVVATIRNPVRTPQCGRRDLRKRGQKETLAREPKTRPAACDASLCIIQRGRSGCCAPLIPQATLVTHGVWPSRL